MSGEADRDGGLNRFRNAWPERRMRTAAIVMIGASSWSLVVFFVVLLIGHWFKEGQYMNAFVLVTAFPIVGLLGWCVLAFRPSRFDIVIGGSYQ